MKGYNSEIAIASRYKLDFESEMEANDRFHRELRVARINDEKRIFDLRWQAFCHLVAKDLKDGVVELNFLWNLTEDMVQRAGLR